MIVAAELVCLQTNMLLLAATLMKRFGEAEMLDLGDLKLMVALRAEAGRN